MPREQDHPIDDDDVITIWGHVVEGYHRVTRDAEAWLAERYDLPAPWFEVMLRLQRSPDHRLPMTQLANEVSFSSGGFTKLADRIEHSGYIARSACPSDRRVTWLELTATGAELMERLKVEHVAWLRTHVIDVLGPDRSESLSRAMRDLRDHDPA